MRLASSHGGGVTTYRDLREIYRVRGDARLPVAKIFYIHKIMSDSEAPYEEPSPKRQKRVSKKKIPPIPEAYVKGPGEEGELHPHYRKHFPDDEEDEKGRGKVWHGGPEGCGEWRIVPGFWWIIASSLGHIATRYAKKVRKQTVLRGYFRVKCNEKPEQVHNLVARAFHGVPGEEDASVDHIHTNEQDNRADQLRWATRKTQRENQGERKPDSRGEACLVWRVHGGKNKFDRSAEAMTPTGEEQEFLSATQAANQLGLQRPALSAVLREKVYKIKNKKDGFWYTGRLRDADKELEGEEWSETEVCRISNHGRIRTRKKNGWGPMRMSTESDKDGYKMVCYKPVHILVGETFFVGPRPLGSIMWDHIDGDKNNNHISNLRPVPVSVNNRNTKKSRPIWIWKLETPDVMIYCEGQWEAVENYGLRQGNLSALLHKRKNAQGYLKKSVNGYGAQFADEEE